MFSTRYVTEIGNHFVTVCFIFFLTTIVTYFVTTVATTCVAYFDSFYDDFCDSFYSYIKRDPLDDDNDTFTDSINDIQEDGDGLEAQIPLQHH